MNIGIDEDTCRELSDYAAEIGIPATSLVNANIKQMLRTRQVAFSTAFEPTRELEGTIKDTERVHRAKSNITVTETDEETLAHLRSL